MDIPGLARQSSTGSSSSTLTGGSPYVKSTGIGQANLSEVRCKDKSGSEAMLAFLIDCYARAEQEERKVGASAWLSKVGVTVSDGRGCAVRTCSCVHIFISEC